MEQPRYLKDLDYRANERPSADQLKKRWKDLCRKHHPDAKGDPRDFRRVTHAFNMLTDADYRHQDQLRELRTKRNAKGDLNLRIQVPVTFEDAFFGREISVSYNRIEIDGEGTPIVKTEMDVVYQRVVLPAGCVGGLEVVIEGGGHSSGDDRGLAHLLFMPLPHRRFRVEGADVVSTEEIPLDVLLKGGKIEVATMYGVQAVRIPAGTAPGTRLPIPGCGVQKIGAHQVEVQPRFPTKGELRGAAWKGLEVDWGETPAERVVDDEAEQMMNLFKKLGGA
jgi:DnaJ-class molecular chaperone